MSARDARIEELLAREREQERRFVAEFDAAITADPWSVAPRLWA